MRIGARVAKRLAQCGERFGDGLAIRLRVAAHRERRIGLAFVFDEPHGQRALRHVADLTHLACIEAHEVRFFGGKRRQRRFACGEPVLDGIGKHREMALPVDRPGRHRVPPKTSTSLNTHAGDAWPTRTICIGSPLPHIAVPNTPRVSSLPTAARLCQNVADMPR